MIIKRYLEEKEISVYRVAQNAHVAYPTVFNIVNGKVDLMNCSLGVVKKVADALNLSVDELITLCDKDYSFDLFRSEQCHLVHRIGETNYIVNLLDKKMIDYYWNLNMKIEALYLLGMLDYLCRRNNLPQCEEYNEIRKYKLEKKVYPPDTLLYEKLLDKKFKVKAQKKAIPEFLEFNIVEYEIV
jgi:plasmid maintenance system antidote protein VapI